VELAIPEMFDTKDDCDELLDILDDLPLLVATFDRDGRLLFLNETGRRLLGWEESVSEKTLLRDLFTERDSERLLSEALAQAARSRIWSGRGDLVHRDRRPIAVQAELVTHAPGEKKLRAFTIVARPMDGEPLGRQTASSRFLHDLNNLLGPILVYASLAHAQVEETSPIKRYLGQILGAAEGARELLGRVQRLKTAGASGETSPIVLADLVRGAVDWLRVEHPRHRFETDLASSASVVGDRGGLEQVVSNLCYTAVESLAGEEGLVTITLREVEEGRKLRLTVRDNGSGMEPEVLSRIFEPFFSTKPGSAGVGLAATREVVRMHGGTIHIESAPGAGTSVHVELPVFEDPGATIEARDRMKDG
jgi:signal transduction histidine kinase